jgi:glucokinase
MEKAGFVSELYLGVDCGGTSLRIATASKSGDVVLERVVSTGLAQEKENGLGEAIVSLVESVLPEPAVRGQKVGGIGVGLPFVCWDGKAHLCRNVRALDPLWLEERLQQLCGARVAITNDVKCAALGESWLGAARGADPFVYLNVGTGLSAALFVDGKVHQGAHNAAGEIAYWAIEPGEPKHLALGVGPLEEAMSGVGLSGAYRRASRSDEDISTAEIFRRAGEGDSLAVSLVERGLGYLLPAVANMLTFADPELLVIGGGVAKGLVMYADRIDSYVRSVTPFPPRIAWSTLGGRAGLIGAVRLAMSAQNGSPAI